jgi:AmmeMemoRadiSam system protein B
MKTRKMMLNEGWYPRDAAEISRYTAAFRGGSGANGARRVARAAIAPHAGWFYSGRLSALAFASLEKDADTVIIAGGHLPASAPVLFAEEDAADTPLGAMPIDRELRSLVQQGLRDAGLCAAADNYADNSVEVLLPFACAMFPDAHLLALRIGANAAAFEAGRLIAQAASSLRRRAVLVGSTDLTHYGAAYGFCPKESGKAALDWVRDVNDRRFIDAVLSGNPDMALERVMKERSACSAGAALLAMGFARELAGGSPPAASLLEYGTSADAEPDTGESADTFVGYAAIAL